MHELQRVLRGVGARVQVERGPVDTGLPVFDRAFLTGFQALVIADLRAQAAHGKPGQLLIERLRLRAVAPGAAQRTSFQKDGRAHSRAVVHRKRLDIIYSSRNHDS